MYGHCKKGKETAIQYLLLNLNKVESASVYPFN